MIPPILKSRLAQGQCVAYVGAGFSMPCGMPGWKSLLEALWNQVCSSDASGSEPRVLACKASIDSGNFEAAASMLRDLLLPAEFEEVVQRQFGVHRLSEIPDNIRIAQLSRLRALANGPWAGIVTTNYDTLIETALAERVVIENKRDSDSSQLTNFCNREVIAVTGDDPKIGSILARPPAGGFFVKIHGSISGTSVVLSTEDYDRTYLSTPRMTSFLTALMLRYHTVFIGCSLEDELLRLRRKLASEFKGVIPVSYALLPKTEMNRHRVGWLRTHAIIESILYEPDESHSPVGVFLEEAAKCSDWIYRRSKVPGITHHLREAEVSKRLENIGEVNIRLLKTILSQIDHKVKHEGIVELDRLSTESRDETLFRISPEERVYRILFLVSIGLLFEEVDSDGLPVYGLVDDVAERLAP